MSKTTYNFYRNISLYMQQAHIYLVSEKLSGPLKTRKLTLKSQNVSMLTTATK